MTNAVTLAHEISEIQNRSVGTQAYKDALCVKKLESFAADAVKEVQGDACARSPEVQDFITDLEEFEKQCPDAVSIPKAKRLLSYIAALETANSIQPLQGDEECARRLVEEYLNNADSLESAVEASIPVIAAYRTAAIAQAPVAPPADGGVLGEIAAERQRQRDVEGFTDKHDDWWDDGQMACAAAAYALTSKNPDLTDEVPPAKVWPWDWSWWKPKGVRQNLIRAAALLVAEIERLDRAAAPAHNGKGV